MLVFSMNKKMQVELFYKELIFGEFAPKKFTAKNLIRHGASFNSNMCQKSCFKIFNHYKN